MTRIELGGAAAPAAGRLMVAGSSDKAMRSADRLEIPDELPDLERGPEDPTAIRTVLTGTTGVLISACGSCCGRGSGCITWTGGAAVFFSSGRSLISGRFAWVEDESDRRSPFWKLHCRPPLGWLVVLRRTTLLRAGGGLVSRLRTGEDGRDDGNCPLPARAGRLISRGRMLSLAGSFSSGTEDVDAFIALRLVITREAGRAGGEDWRTGGEGWRTGGEGWRTGGEDWRTGGEDGRRGRAGVLWAGGPAAAWPSPSRALVRALSFMGTGISSSELSFKVEYCCGCELDSLLTGAATALPAGCDSLRLS